LKIKYFAHASFLITSQDGVRIVTDPYEPGCFGGALKYGRIEEPADIAVVSHDHADHNYVKGVPGSPDVVLGPGSHEVKEIPFTGIETHHDPSGGSERGSNTVFLFEVDGLRVAHLGDLGRPLSEGERRQLGHVDVLFVPVGGHFTIDAREATEIIEELQPRIVVPMHYKTPSVDFPIAGIDTFLEGKAHVDRISGSEWEVSVESLPDEQRIVVLQPSC
jgi:L-ascorbate metabolism protein UlaG (beta-lactamase superfamily)